MPGAALAAGRNAAQPTMIAGIFCHSDREIPSDHEHLPTGTRVVALRCCPVPLRPAPPGHGAGPAQPDLACAQPGLACAQPGLACAQPGLACAQPDLPGARPELPVTPPKAQRAPSNLQAAGRPGVPLAMIRILICFPAGRPHGHGTADATPPSPSPRATHFAPVTESICTPGYRNASRQPSRRALLVMVISAVKPAGQRCIVWYHTSTGAPFRCAGGRVPGAFVGVTAGVVAGLTPVPALCGAPRCLACCSLMPGLVAASPPCRCRGPALPQPGSRQCVPG